MPWFTKNPGFERFHHWCEPPTKDLPMPGSVWQCSCGAFLMLSDKKPPHYNPITMQAAYKNKEFNERG